MGLWYVEVNGTVLMGQAYLTMSECNDACREMKKSLGAVCINAVQMFPDGRFG